MMYSRGESGQSRGEGAVGGPLAADVMKEALHSKDPVQRPPSHHPMRPVDGPVHQAFPRGAEAWD